MKHRSISALTMMCVISVFCGTALISVPVTAEEEAAEALAGKLRENSSKYFPKIDGVDELASPLCIIAHKEEQTEYLLTDELPAVLPDEAAAVLLVDMVDPGSDDEEEKKPLNCKMTYGAPDGSVSFVIGERVQLEEEEDLADLINNTYTFSEGPADLFEKIVSYQDELESRDYLSAINACRDDYASAGTYNIEDIADPIVYMVDADAVCTPAAGDLAFSPAENNQYVPAENDNYERPEIEDPISLGISAFESNPGNDGSHYTLEDVESLLESPKSTFCFSEIIGWKPFGDFTSKSSGDTITANSYDMRVSVIDMEGNLLGYRDLSYSYDPAEDFMGLTASYIGITLSRDKNDTVVFPWGYESEIYKQ